MITFVYKNILFQMKLVNKMMITIVSYANIYDIWRNHLWPERTSAITPTSAMIFLGGYDTGNMNNTATFFAFVANKKIYGVNSGHLCTDGSYRSRGLFVFPEYRNKGIGTDLLLATIDQGNKESAKFTWSYPKQTSWNAYKKAGYSLSSPWEKSELGFNAYCIKNY